MSRNIIITGAGGNLGSAVVEKFKREGYHVIALVNPSSDELVEDADDSYEVDVTNEESVDEFVSEYQLQYGELDAMALLVGGYASGEIVDSKQQDFEKMISLNFFSAYHLVKGFLPILKKQSRGTFLFVGAKPALQMGEAVDKIAYAMSKKMVMTLAEIIGKDTENTAIRSHVFVPSIIDTPENRAAMPDADFGKWVSPKEIAEAMHYAVNVRSLRNMTFKLYGEV